ncbi:chromosomal replication initiator DnaA [Parasphingorhabdus sp.]|uniref:chromosomal replication initiator DnaA n=1 Tax=Parasphingorhabdus sp. TaxID=2709688 RepID=UPI003A8F78A8
MSQIALPLEQNPSPDGDGYLVTAANAEVHRYLQNWREWPHHTMILTGPEASGKSTMAATFEAQSGGLFLDDADQCDDTEMFHLWNRANAEKKPLLLLSEKPVSEWGVSLPDLKSRLAASLHREIGPPDQAMIEGLFQKYFAVRGLTISQDALRYLEKRMIRSYAMVRQLAQKMDALAIETKKPVNLAIAKSALGYFDSGDEKVDS